ncbi:hypothetical protein BASA81_000954 [Batrachochytrium salamandrivorans]|nr:hypothetical protein BASA81_000954 [Batrachochytrium salamandrivorans]
MLTGFLFGSQAQRNNREAKFAGEIDSLLDRVFAPQEFALSQRKEACFGLKSLAESSEEEHAQDFCRAYCGVVNARCQDFEALLPSSEDEDIVQTLLDILHHCCETSKEAGRQYLLLKDSAVASMLLKVLQASKFVWARVSALECIGALVANSPQETVNKLLSVPNALETLFAVLRDKQREVRNELLLVLQRLTEASDQVGMFIMFCDGPVDLLNIAVEEGNRSVVSGDCLAVLLAALQSNSVARKQFVETQLYLNQLSVLLLLDKDDGEEEDRTPAMLRIARAVELVGVLSQGRLESNLQVVQRPAGACLRDTAVVKQAQSKLGSTLHLLERMFRIATCADRSLVELETERQALVVLGDLICKHSSNASRFERLGGFSHLASCALHSKWLEAKACMYAWVCALEGDEQRAIALIGAAVATGEEDDEEGEEGELEESKVPAVSMLAKTMFQSACEVTAMRGEVYVDPSRVQALRVSLWKACRLWEVLLGSSSSTKEMALRIEVSSHSLFAFLCQTVVSLSQKVEGQDDGEPDNVRALVQDCVYNLSRVLVIWISGSAQTSAQFLSLAANLAFFQLEDGITALVAAASLGDDKQPPIAFGLIENQGVAGFLSRLDKIKPLLVQGANKGFTWQDDSSASLVFDSHFSALVLGDLLKRTERLLVKGSAAAMVATSEATSAVIGPVGPVNDSKLQQDHAKLLLLLTCKQVEIESLLQSVQTLGGPQAVEEARAKAKLLVSTLLEASRT